MIDKTDIENARSIDFIAFVAPSIQALRLKVTTFLGTGIVKVSVAMVR